MLSQSLLTACWCGDSCLIYNTTLTIIDIIEPNITIFNFSASPFNSWLACRRRPFCACAVTAVTGAVGAPVWPWPCSISRRERGRWAQCTLALRRCDGRRRRSGTPRCEGARHWIQGPGYHSQKPVSPPQWNGDAESVWSSTTFQCVYIYGTIFTPTGKIS